MKLGFRFGRQRFSSPKDESPRIETAINGNSRTLNPMQSINDLIWPQNGQTPLVQNFIDFRPFVDRLMDQEHSDQSGARGLNFKSSDGKDVMATLQEENTKLNHRVNLIQVLIKLINSLMFSLPNWPSLGLK